MTRREMMARMGVDELAEWIAYDRVEPLPDPYLVAAIVARTVAAWQGAKGRALALESYYWPAMERHEEPRRQTTAEMMAAWESIVERHERGG